MGNVGSRNKKRSQSRRKRAHTGETGEKSRRKLSRRSVSFRDDPDVREIETRQAEQAAQESDQKQTAQESDSRQTSNDSKQTSNDSRQTSNDSRQTSQESDSRKPSGNLQAAEPAQNAKGNEQATADAPAKTRTVRRVETSPSLKGAQPAQSSRSLPRRRRSRSSSGESSDNELNLYASSAREKEQSLQQQQAQMISQMQALALQGVPLAHWKTMRERPTMETRLHTSSRALVQEILPNGALRVVLEDEQTSRTVWLDNVSIPSAESNHTEEAMAAQNAVQALSFLLEGKLVLVHFGQYDSRTDQTFVRLFLLKSPAPVSGTTKTIDHLVRTQPAGVKYKMPDDIAGCIVDDTFVNINRLVAKIKGCFIVLGQEPRDWFVRKSDWRRLQNL